jgi:steroid delta-isomerase-like uncharacterized protein
MIQDDAVLVERVLSGDKAAFGPLIDRHWPKALSFALRRLGNFADAEDIVQNAFLRALLDLPSLRSADRFGSWLLGIVVNLCRIHRRMRRNDYAYERPTFDDLVLDNEDGLVVCPEWSGEHLQPSPEAVSITNEAHRALLAAMASLPDDQQRTVRLHYFDGLPLAEVAMMVGVPVGAVKVRLHRARVRLRTALSGERVPIRKPSPRVQEVFMIDATSQEVEVESSGGPIRLPLVPTRDIVIVPHMVVPLFVGRRKTLRAFEEAIATRKLVFLVAQRDSKINNPTDKDIYEVGTVADVTQCMHLPDGTLKVLVTGKQRARMLRYIDDPNLFLAEIEEMKEHRDSTMEIEQLMSNVKAAFKGSRLKIASTAPEVALTIDNVEEPSRLADMVAAHLNLAIKDKQKLLEILDPGVRLQQILVYLSSTSETRQGEEQAVAGTEEQPSLQEIKDVVETYLHRLETRDVDFLLKSLPEEFVLDESPMTMAEPLCGKQRFQEYLTSFFAAFPDFTLCVTNSLVGQSQASVEWVMKGTHQGVFLGLSPTGKAVEISGTSVFTVRESKIARVRMYWDSGHVRRQLAEAA